MEMEWIMNRTTIFASFKIPCCLQSRISIDFSASHEAYTKTELFVVAKPNTVFCV